MEESMKKTRMFLLGSSLGAALLMGAAHAEAADEVVVEQPAPAADQAVTATETETTTTETKEEKVSPRGLYVGGAVGGSFFTGPGKHSRIFNRNDNPNTSYDDAFTVDKIDDENNFMWSVFVGYRMASWLSAEVGWTDLGGFSAVDTQDFNDPNDVPHKDRVSPDVDGVEARLRAWIPLGLDRLTGIGGVGIYIFQSHSGKKCQGPDKRQCNNPSPFEREQPALDPREDSGQAVTVSAGLQYDVTDNIAIRTEYSHFFSVLDQGVHLVTASVVFGFYDLFGQASGGGDDFGGVVVE
jgi:opacity protein-like surface antigen